MRSRSLTAPWTEVEVKKRTAETFAYEWRRFNAPPGALAANFWGYFQMFSPGFFAGKRVLEGSCGMGRHTHFLATYAQEVVALDLGRAIDVAARNIGRRDNVHFVQADIEAPPFREGSFDFVCAIGVLHHLPHPEAGFRRLLACLRPGGIIHVYLYWALEDAPAWKRGLLRGVLALRCLTTRLPCRVLDKVAWTAAVVGYWAFSVPYRYLSRWAPSRAFAETLPLQRYAAEGFRICYNDQFDRLSAPIEHRYTRQEVEALFQRAGLVDVRVQAHHGWIACGRKPGGDGRGGSNDSSGHG